jgi:hypothetical protein
MLSSRNQNGVDDSTLCLIISKRRVPVSEFIVKMKIRNSKLTDDTSARTRVTFRFARFFVCTSSRELSSRGRAVREPKNGKTLILGDNA